MENKLQSFVEAGGKLFKMLFFYGTINNTVLVGDIARMLCGITGSKNLSLMLKLVKLGEKKTLI